MRFGGVDSGTILKPHVPFREGLGHLIIEVLISHTQTHSPVQVISPSHRHYTHNILQTQQTSINALRDRSKFERLQTHALDRTANGIHPKRVVSLVKRTSTVTIHKPPAHAASLRCVTVWSMGSKFGTIYRDNRIVEFHNTEKFNAVFL
jgi:hypothetical protein